MPIVTITKYTTIYMTRYLDKECLNHIIRNNKLLNKFNLSKIIKVNVTNNNSMEVEQMRNVLVHFPYSNKPMIENMVYVPNIKCNLMAKKGYLLIMEDNILELYYVKKRLILKSILAMNRIFKTLINALEGNYLATIIQDNENILWRNRYDYFFY